jgi:DinB family protein
MPPQFLTLYAFTLAMCERLMADIPQEEMERQPNPGVNPPAWILGHLAICTDYALQLMGRPMQLPAAWHEEFGQGSSPLPQKHPYPTRDELLNALRSGHAAVVNVLPSIDAKQLAAPNPLNAPFLQQTLPTVGDLLAHLLSTHEAAHLGHLSNWRRQMGRSPLF